MSDRPRRSPAPRPLVVDIGPLREVHYTGIPNVVAEVVARVLREPWLDLRFVLDGRAVPAADVRGCLAARSGAGFGVRFGSYPPADTIPAALREAGTMDRAVALYTDHRPPHRTYPREGKIVYDLSMVLVPECHPVGSVAMYTADLAAGIAASDVLFPISEATARDLAWLYGVPRERLRVALLGHTVDLTLADRVRAAIGDRPVEPFLLVLGSIEPRKNAALVLEWAARHPEVLEETRIVFAGRQAWGESFGALVEARSLRGAVEAGRIAFMGYVDERLKAALLVGAAGLLYPSIFEGFGLPLLDAMATGTPVLASVSTSMPEVVGDCGYYFDPYDVGSLHAAFRRLWSDRASGAVRDVVARARDRAATFDYDRTTRVILDGLFPGNDAP